MKWNADKLCFTADDGSRLERSGAGNGCRGHDTGHGTNTYKCSKAFCAGNYEKWLVKELYGAGVRRKVSSNV
jgi:hypothetical protein